MENDLHNILLVVLSGDRERRREWSFGFLLRIECQNSMKP